MERVTPPFTSPRTGFPSVLLLLSSLLALTIPAALSWPRSDAAHVSPSVVATIPVATNEEVSGIGVDAVAGRVFIGRQPSGPPLCLSVIDAASNAIISDLLLPYGEYLQTIEVNETTSRVYAVDSFMNTLFIVDGDTNTLVTSHSGSGFGYGIAVDEARNVVYWTKHDSLAVIDGTTDSVVSHIPLGPAELRDVAINAATNIIYVTNETMGELIVVDGFSQQVTDRVSVGTPRELAVNPATNRVYVTDAASGVISVIDGATDQVIASISVASYIEGIAVNPITNRIYATGHFGGNLHVIDGTTNLPASTVFIGDEPFEVAANSVTDLVYVGSSSNFTQGRVSVVGDTAELTSPGTLPPATACRASSPLTDVSASDDSGTTGDAGELPAGGIGRSAERPRAVAVGRLVAGLAICFAGASILRSLYRSHRLGP